MSNLKGLVQAAAPWVLPDQLARLVQHAELILKWNDRAGLVSKATVASGLETHLVDCLKITAFAARQVGRLPVMDLGSGGGLPGLVYASCYPEHSVTLFERANVKRAFLEIASQTLALGNVSIEAEPVRPYPPALWLSRAALPPAELFPYVRQFASDGSVLVACAGGSGLGVRPEANFAKLAEESYELPAGAGMRHVSAWQIVPRGTATAKK